MKSLFASASLFALATLLAIPVRADLAPPETQPCQGKAAGAACNYNGAGACRSETCTKLDYANWDHDASTSPPSTTYACLKCVPGEGTATTTTTTTATTTTTSTATTTTTSTATATKTDDNPPPAKDDGACSVGKSSAAKRVAPWMLAGAFSLLFLFGRRRKQS